MKSKIFDLDNVNSDVLNVPQEHGGAEDDNYMSCIGSSTNKHVLSLSGAERQMWDELYVGRSGGIFRFVPSTNWHEKDPFDLKDVDLKVWLEEYVETHYKGTEIPEKDAVFLKECIEEEELRRSESEDVYDHADADRISYSEWERYPQFWKQVEMPSSPKDHSVYMGNTRDMFYDHRPENHPDISVIDKFLYLLNQDWSDLTEDYLDNVAKQLVYQDIKPYTRKYLTDLVDALRDDNSNPQEAAKFALSEIDRCWSIEHKNVFAESLAKDHVYTLMRSKYREWVKLTDNNINVYSQVKSLGSLLYKKYKGKTKGHHWNLYRKMKRKFAPKVIFQGVDINKARISDLTKITKDKDKSRAIWNARPFENANEAINKGLLTRLEFAGNSNVDLVLDRIDHFALKVENSKNIGNFQPLSDALIKGQQNGSLKINKNNLLQFTPRDWSTIWSYYRMIKTDISMSLKRK